MGRQTLVERLCKTQNLVARHLLQDEAARLGAQGMISEQLEARLALTEASGLLNEAPGTMIRRHLQDETARGDAQNLVCEQLESNRIHERAKDVLAIEPKPLMLPESDSTEVQWLRGVAVPSEELSERSLQPLSNA